MNKQYSLVCTLALMTFSTAVLSAQIGLCGKRSTSVEFALDTSSSMGEVYGVRSQEFEDKQKTKIEHALQFVRQITDELPDSETMRTSIQSFLPASSLIKNEKRTGETFAKAIADLRVTVASNPENSLDKKSLDYFARKRQEPTTLFLITDGDIDKGAHDPFKVLQTFYQNNPKSCVHIVSLAQTQSEKIMVNRLRQANVCSTMVTMTDLINKPYLFNSLMQSYVYRDCAAKNRMEVPGIPFIKQSVKLEKKAIVIADQLLEVVAQRPVDEAIRIVGWTDSVGDAAFNKTIALQRAQAVKDYLALKGVSPNRMTAIGAGESDKFDNSSEGGRKLNRRVDVIFGQ